MEKKKDIYFILFIFSVAYIEFNDIESKNFSLSHNGDSIHDRKITVFFVFFIFLGPI